MTRKKRKVSDYDLRNARGKAFRRKVQLMERQVDALLVSTHAGGKFFDAGVNYLERNAIGDAAYELRRIVNGDCTMGRRR